MRTLRAGSRLLVCVLILVPVLACDATTPDQSDIVLAAAEANAPVRGYVMARWHDEIPHGDPGECPEGLNLTEKEFYPEAWAALDALRERGASREEMVGILPPDACQDPLAQPDPGYLTLDGPAVVYGLDLDGTASKRADSAGASCEHDDFVGHDGAAGIDNQFWRLMGCVAGFRPDGLMDRLNGTNSSVKEGGYAILLEISGMDDPQNDDEVEVQLISANEPAVVDAVGGIMQNVSLTAHIDSRYHNPIAKGRIENGVLTSDPVDIRIKVKKQTMDNEYFLRDARIRGEVQADGRIKGIVGAYWDIQNMFSALNEQRFGDYHLGRSAAYNRGFMCAGIYHAMPRVADGHPDPESGECTSISTAIHFEAVPAFVIRPQMVMVD